MKTLEEQITELQNTNSQLVYAVNSLTSDVNGKINEIDNEVAEKKAEVDQFLADAQPEPRIVHDIFIGGSPDYFYPVWWQFPSSSGIRGAITISRRYFWNGDIEERPLNPDTVHQAGLLLEVDGGGHGSGGDPKFVEVKRFSTTYTNTISHLSLFMYSKTERIDPSKPCHYQCDDNFKPYCHSHSGIYLRGGGLNYRISKNWSGEINYHKGEDLLRRDLHRSLSNNVCWYAEPVHISNALVPKTTLNAYVDPA